jgi:hypothetical protein
MLKFLRKNMQKFKKVPDRSVKIKLLRRRRRGCIYFLSAEAAQPIGLHL